MFLFAIDLINTQVHPCVIVGFALASLAPFFGKSTCFEPGKNYDSRKI